MDGRLSQPARPIHTWLALLLSLGLGLRLLPIVCYGANAGLFMDADSYEYHQLASNLLAGHGYSWETQLPYTPNLYRTPGFPLVLAGLYAVGGPSVPVAIAVQGVLGTIAVFLTFHLTRMLTGRFAVAFTAALLLALDPVAIQYSNLLLTETLNATVLLLAVLCVLKYWRSNRSGWLLAAGGLLAAGILLHPILVFLPLAFAAIPLLRRQTRTSGQLGGAVGAMAIALMPAATWIGRNWCVGDFAGISPVTAVNLLKYKAAGVEAELRGTSREIERDRLTGECELELPAGATRGDRFRLWQRRGSAIILAHPLTYAMIHVKGMLLELIGPERDHTTRLLYGGSVLEADGRYTETSIAAARTQRMAPALEIVRRAIQGWQALLLIGLLTGAWRLAGTRPRILAGLLIIPMYVLLLSGGPEASPRFRVLYLPMLSLLTAVSVTGVPATRRERSDTAERTVNDSFRVPSRTGATRRPADQGSRAMRFAAEEERVQEPGPGSVTLVSREGRPAPCRATGTGAPAPGS